MKKDQQLSFNKLRSLFFFGLIALLSIAILYLFRPFLFPVFWAAVIAVMFYPLFKRTVAYVKWPGVSAVMVILVVIAILILPLTLITVLVARQSIELYQSINQGAYLNSASQLPTYLEGTILSPYIETIQNEWTSFLTTIAQKVGPFLFSSIASITQNTLRFFFMLFIMFYTLFYFLKDGPRMLRRFMHLSPLGDEYEEMLYKRFTSTTRATLKSTMIVGSIQGLIGGILFWSVGIEGAFVWGVIMAILSIIPAVGSFLIWLPAAIILLALGQVWQGVTVLLVGSLIISTIDNFLRPPLVGKDIQMHPVIVLFSTLGGIFLFGVSGFVIGPILAALYLSVISIYDHYYRHELQNN